MSFLIIQLMDIHLVIVIDFSRYVPDLFLYLLGVFNDIQAEYRSIPGCREYQSKESSNGGRFASTVRSDESEDFTGFDFQIEVDDSPVFSVEFCQVLGFDHICQFAFSHS